MRYSDVFGSCHPAVNFLYFMLVIAFSMCLTHPVCLLLSVCGAVIYHAVLLGPRSLRKNAVWMVPMAVLAAVINPAFTHQGVTILAYLPSGNPLTLESMLYGLASAALLSATLLWFTCYNAVMTSDKFIYLFGRVIPALSLVLSMTMRFVPRFRTQLHTVAQAQKAAVVPFFLKGVADGPDPTRLFQPDRIHPRAEAHPQMLANVWPELKKLLR